MTTEQNEENEENQIPYHPKPTVGRSCWDKVDVRMQKTGPYEEIQWNGPDILFRRMK